MRGQVVETRPAGGQILGEDGQRYKFMGTDWKSVAGAEAGTEVEFVPVGERATQVFAVRPAGGGWEAAARPASGDSSVLFGWIGIACLVLGFAIPVLPVAAAFIFGLMGASVAKARGNATGLLLSRIAWIGAVAMTAIGAVLVAWFASVAWPLFEAMWQVFEGILEEGLTAQVRR